MAEKYGFRHLIPSSTGVHDVYVRVVSSTGIGARTEQKTRVNETKAEPDETEHVTNVRRSSQ